MVLSFATALVNAPPRFYSVAVAATVAFRETFATLRGILEPHAKKLSVTLDKPGVYQLSSSKLTDRVGRPLFAACVRMGKSYVSYHFMPVYACPELLEELSPALRKRMQGKSCFNFTTIDAAQVKELTAFTKKGFARFEKIKLPWDA
jgi:hypothetical protein